MDSEPRLCANHAMTMPMDVYVPLVMQNTAKYLACGLVGTTNTIRYPIAARKHELAMTRPRVWKRSVK